MAVASRRGRPRRGHESAREPHGANLTGRAAALSDHFDPIDGGATASYVVPFFPVHGDAKGRQGFVRVTNRSEEAADVSIRATDVVGTEYEELTLHVGPGQTRHFNSEDLESGNPDKGLTGSTGPMVGECPFYTDTCSASTWRLIIASEEPAVDGMAYVRTPGGFRMSMHEVLPFETTVEGSAQFRSVFFNPASNGDQVSVLYAVNLNGIYTGGLSVGGFDDANVRHTNPPGSPFGTYRYYSFPLGLQAGLTQMVTSQRLEAGTSWRPGLGQPGIGDGDGKWQLTIFSSRTHGIDGRPFYSGEVIPTLPVVMSLLENPTGHITNLSTQDLCTRGLTVSGCPNQ